MCLPQLTGDPMQRRHDLVVENPPCRLLHGTGLLVDCLAGDKIRLLDDMRYRLLLGFDRPRDDARLKGPDVAEQPGGREFQLVARFLESRCHRVDAIEHLREVAERLCEQCRELSLSVP